MSTPDLWRQLTLNPEATSHFFGRDLVAIKKTDFEKFRDQFTYSYNPLNNTRNYRTREFFAHIHAVECGEYVEVHIDYFNPTALVLLALPHLFSDVIPYFVWFAFTLRKPYTIHFN